MNTTVLVFHPDLSNRSTVNARLAEAAREAGAEVRDMYALYPDFAVDAAAEQQVLEAADRIVWQFPMYWYSSPALLKQWEDAVLTYGWAYGSTGNALHGKELMLAVSPGASADAYAREGKYLYEVAELLRPFQATAALTGLTFLRPFVTAGTMSLSGEALERRAAKYAAALTGPREPLGPFDV